MFDILLHKMQPKISIIIPTFNRAHLIGETLDSVIVQTHKNWECIVIDDGSTDYTQELLEFYIARSPQISFFKRPKNKLKGANACRNYGFEISNGAYVNWFDDDDIMHPEKLEKQLKFITESSCNYSVCQSLVFQNNINDIKGVRNKNIISDQPFYDYLRMKIGWLTQAPLWKREFLLELDSLFDEELKAAQEWEFHLRVLNKYPEYVAINDELVLLRKHERSITYNRNKALLFWYYYQARLKVFKNPNLNLDSKSNQFLREYLLNSFKKMVTTRNPKVVQAYNMFILPANNISTTAKLNALLAIVAFKLFNKGNVVLQKVKFN